MPSNFTERHARKGIMTNQPGTYDKDRPHASTVVCDRDECQERARFWVSGTTNEPAVYVPDPHRAPSRMTRDEIATDADPVGAHIADLKARGLKVPDDLLAKAAGRPS